MAKLSSVTVANLHEALADVSAGKAAKRLMIALAYKDGVSVETLSERYDIPRSTIYYWFDRFEDLPIEEAIEDDNRPGRPPELIQEDREELESDLAQPPQTFDFNSDTWSIRVIQEHLREKYGVRYSQGHIRRLLRTGEFDFNDGE